MFWGAGGTEDISPHTASSLGSILRSRRDREHLTAPNPGSILGSQRDRGPLPMHCAQSGQRFGELEGQRTSPYTPHSIWAVFRGAGGTENIPSSCFAGLQPALKPHSTRSAHSSPFPPTPEGSEPRRPAGVGVGREGAGDRSHQRGRARGVRGPRRRRAGDAAERRCHPAAAAGAPGSLRLPLRRELSSPRLLP